MSREWRFYLRDMRDSCSRILNYSKGLERKVFDGHGIEYDAILRNLETLGEAAGKIPVEIRDQEREVAWQKLIGMRNIIVHEYFGIDDDIIWDVVTAEIAPLYILIEKLVLRYP